ncbi:MAG: zinc transporter ZupT [Firmicutes bacterium]|nr:zinc transporter ZupT [Bacillota bacterium]
MPKALIPLIISSIAGFSTVIGSFIIFFKIKPFNINKFITFCLAFSMMIMIGISITDLIPNSFFTCLQYYSFIKVFFIVCIAFIFSILIITFLSTKIDQASLNDNLYKLGFLNMLVLIFHNLPEGIATFLSSYQDISLGIKLSIAIMLHNIPEGICIAVPIYYATNNKIKAIKSAFLSGFAEPLGALLAFIFLKNYISEVLVSIVLIIVGGLMITLSIQEILPKAISYQENKLLNKGLIAGVLIIVINLIFHLL